MRLNKTKSKRIADNNGRYTVVREIEVHPTRVFRFRLIASLYGWKEALRYALGR